MARNVKSIRRQYRTPEAASRQKKQWEAKGFRVNRRLNILYLQKEELAHHSYSPPLRLRNGQHESYALPNAPRRVLTVSVYCNDREGNQHDAKLSCRVDHVDIGTQKVEEEGSWLDFDSDVEGSRVFLESEDDITDIEEVHVYGI